MNNKKPQIKNPLWETFTAGMDNKWSKRLLMVMTPLFIGLLIARPYIDEKVEKRIKLRTQEDEEKYQKDRQEKLRKLKESGDPILAATVESIEERKRASDQLLSKPK